GFALPGRRQRRLARRGGALTMASKFERVAVIGAGTMGAGIAQTFATFGANVRLVDVSPEVLERGKDGIAKSLARVVKKCVMDQAAADATVERIATSTKLADCRDAQIVVEAVAENVAIKSKVLAELDQVC